MITMYYIVLLETWGDSKAIKNLPDDHNNKHAVLPWQPYCGHFQTEHKGVCFFYRTRSLPCLVSQSVLVLNFAQNFEVMQPLLVLFIIPQGHLGKRPKRTPFI